MKTNKVVVVVAFLLAAGVGFAQGARGMGGGGISGQPIDGTVIKPRSVQASGTQDQFMCTATTSVCEVESNISAATMTSTVPAFDIGPTATPNSNDRLACFSYGPSGSKTRVMCVDTEGDVNMTSLAVGTTSTGIRSHTVVEGSTSDVYAPTTFNEKHAVFGRIAASGATSGAVFLTYNSADNEGVIGSLSPTTAWRPLRFGGSEWKFQQAGNLVVANITSTGAYNSVASSGNQAFSCTNTGCRLSLGNTGRYLFDNGTNLASNSIFSASQFVSRYHTASGTPVEVGTTVAATEPNPIQFSTSATFTSETANFVSAFNGPNQIFAFSKDGLLRVNKHNAAKPTCNATNRGRVYYSDGAAGVPDTYEVCSKNAADAYAWVQVGFSSENASAPMTLTSNTPDSVTSGTVPAIRLQASQNITDTDLLLTVEDSAGNRRVAISELGNGTFAGNVTAGSGVITNFINQSGYGSRGNNAITIPDDGAGTPAAYTWQPQFAASVTYFTCNDANGCEITMSLGASFGGVYNRAFNVGTNTVTFKDTAGLSEMAGDFAMGQWDTIEFMVVSGRFVELNRSNN